MRRCRLFSLQARLSLVLFLVIIPGCIVSNVVVLKPSDMHSRVRIDSLQLNNSSLIRFESGSGRYIPGARNITSPTHRIVFDSVATVYSSEINLYQSLMSTVGFVVTVTVGFVVLIVLYRALSTS